MLELRLRYQGNGAFQTAGKLDYELVTAELEQGETVRAKVSRSRSVRQNNLFHVMIQEAWTNKSGPGPDLPSWRALKDWLLIQAGHCAEKRIAVGRLTMAEAKAAGVAIATGLRTTDDFVAVAYDRTSHEFVLRTAKSVSFRAADREAMGEIMDRVMALIETEIMPGTPRAELENEARRKAA